MYTRQTNPIAQRSQRMLSAALLQLMEQYPYGDITVLQLCQQAQLARKTFYRGFENKDDVLDFTLDGLLREFDESYLADCRGLEPEVRACFAFFCAKKELLALLYRAGLLYLITKKLREYLQQAGCAAPEGTTLAAMQPYYEQYIASAVACVLELWVRRGFVESEQALGDFILRMLPCG